MKKFGKVLLSGALCLVMLLLVLPTITPRVSALTGDGTYYNPYKPTTYAEFKRVLEMPGEHYIVVDRMDNTTGLSYIDISDEYTSGDCAINIPAGAYKDVTINCDLDFRTNSLNKFLYSFIGNRGKLYLDGRGSITASMNGAGFPSAVIINYNTLDITGGVSLWGTISSASQPGSFARAIYNYTDGKLLITSGSQGTFYGINASAVLNESTRNGGYIAGGLFQASGGLGYTTYTSALTISGGTFQGIAVTDHANLLRLDDILLSDYKIYTVDNKETISSALRSTDKSVYIAKAKKIRSVELSCTEPKYGAMVSKITTKTAGVNVVSYDWDTGTSYTQGRHVLQIRLEPQSGYSFDKSCEVTLNGDKLDITGLNHTVDGYITLECTYSVSDERPQLNAANFLVTGYEVGKNISDAKVASQSSAVTIRSYTWVDGANNEVSGTFGGQSYGVQIYFDVSDKYQCSNVDKKNITIRNISAYAIHYGGIDFDASLGDLMAVFYLNHLGNVLETVELSSNLAVDMPVSDITVISNHRGIDLTTFGNVNQFAIYDDATGKQVTSGKIQDKPYEITVAFTCNSSYTAAFDPKTDVTLDGMRPVSAKTSQGKYLVSFLFNAPQPAVTPTKLSPLSVYYHDGEGRKVQLLNATDSKREITVYLDELSKSVSGGLVHFVTYTDPLTEEEGHVTFSSSNTDIYDRFSVQKVGYDKADEVLVLFTKTGTATITAKLPNGTKETVKVTVVDSSVQEDTFTVKFDANGGKGTMRDVTFSGDNKYTLPDCTFTAPEGKMFDGWSYDGEKWMPGDKIGMQGDVNTVKALWVDLPVDHICDTEKVAKVKPTETEPGKEAYYVCTGCGNAYEDKAATKLIEDLESWGIIDPLGGQPTEKPSETTEPSESTEPGDSGAGNTPGGNGNRGGIPWWIVLLLALLMVEVGVLVAIIIVKKQEEKAKAEAPTEEQ